VLPEEEEEEEEEGRGGGGSRSWLRNRPSCSSASRFLTLRVREPGFMSGRLASPDRHRLRDTSAMQMSFVGTDNMVFSGQTIGGEKMNLSILD